jgi:polar amino acid transport system substrate-binding protein
MTISSSRAQLVAFSRPYYIEGSGLMVTPKSKYKTLKELVAAGAAVNAAILANVYADDLVHKLLPQAQVLQLDSQAMSSRRLRRAAPMSRSSTLRP